MTRRRMPGPTWKARADALELEDRLEEAEAAIRDGIPHLSFALEVAELYARRMRRMRAAGDHERGAHAFAQARQWAFFFASLATSGGEGAALSGDRDRFLAELGESYRA